MHCFLTHSCQCAALSEVLASDTLRQHPLPEFAPCCICSLDWLILKHSDSVQELLPGNQLMTRAEHRAILSDLGYGPYGWRAIRTYLDSRTNTYVFDYNHEVKMRRLREEALRLGGSLDELYRPD